MICCYYKQTLANYADDNTIYASALSNIELMDTLTKATKLAMEWFSKNGMHANAGKFQFIVFGKNSGTVTFPGGGH
jgi:hypothetical protein